MKKIYIKPINKSYSLSTNYFQINVENNLLFRELTFNIFENIIYSINNVPEYLEKNL